jgi:alpha-tubulin suppressor-like RCC1 family protein
MGACDFTCNPGYVRCGAGCCPTTKLAVGSAHACAIVRAGEVRCWGGNSAGQLGDGTTTDSATPVSVSGLSSGAVAVAAGLDHTCALTGAGTVLCWGNNTSGQLGDGSTVSQSVPVAVVGLSDISAIGTGGSHSCAVSRAGAVQCWGENEFGQLGDGMSGSTAANTMPRSVVGLSSRALAIAGGASHTCALTDQGTVQCWGFNDYGQVGGSVNGAGSNEPFTVPGLLPGIVSIAANGDHTCAINGSGGVQCWGDDRFGEAGDGTTSNQAVPTPSNVLGFSSGAIGIATGFVHACALSAAGGVQCWGRGPLGDGSSADSAMPVTVQGLPSGLVTIGAGYYNTCVATIDGQVLCWGMVPSPVLGL